MGISKNDQRMEGWLYLIRFNRLGLHSSRKRYFVLEEITLNCYKSLPSSKKSDPIRSALVDSCIRVTDNGRETINRKVFFIFTLYNTTNHNDQLKLGAQSSEETAMWIHSLKEATMKDCKSKLDNFVTFSTPNRRSLRLCRKERLRVNSIDWTSFSSIRMDPMSSDVIAPSPWMIIGCNNGLRMFEEAKDGEFFGKHWDVHPAIMAVGVVDATSEAIFRTVISLGPSRLEWDFCLSQGTVVEHLDGHTDIIHKKLRGDWLPWGMTRRDLLLRRYWRREDDGTYVILYHSVFHEKCRPEKGYIRACLKSGGYVISPVNQGKQSVVKHMLSIDWKLWKSYLFSSAEKHVTIRMLGRVAALRELFRAKVGTCSCSKYSGELTREISFPRSEKEDIKVEVLSAGNTSNGDSGEHSRKSSSRSPNIVGSFLQLNDAADEFFDVPDESEIDQAEYMWSGNNGQHSQDHAPSRLSTASVIVKKLHGLAVQRRGCSEQEPLLGNMVACSYGATLPKDSTCSMPCSCTSADPSTFLIRGESYLQDNRKIKANRTLMQLVGADWIKSDKREDDLGNRTGGLVQRHAIQGCSKFFFIVNIQVPGTTTHSLAFYYMMDTPLEDVPLLESFVKGDDAFRNSRFKLIPYISKGSWIVKQSVGKKAGLVGQALEINYFSGKNYLELDVDVGSSTVARGVVNLVLSYLNNLVIEMAFLVQGNTAKELPEVLLGTVRLNHLDITKAVPVNPI